MPRSYLMGFDPSKLRWRKTYKGIAYTVFCSELDLPVTNWNELGSYQAANEWWKTKRATIDGDNPSKQKAEVWKKREAKLIEAGQSELADEYRAVREFFGLDAGAKLTGELLEPDLMRRICLLQNRGVKGLTDLSTDDLREGLGVADYWREKETAKTATAITLGQALDKWIGVFKIRAKKSSLVSVNGYVKKWKDLRHDGRSVLAEGMPLSRIDESKMIEVFGAINANEKAKATKHKIFTHWKTFVRFCAENKLMQRPENLDSKTLVFGSVVVEKTLPPLPEIVAFLNDLPERLRLYALLALNTSCNNVDIANLTPNMVNWQEKTLRRKRIKTSEEKNVPTVTYQLWKCTFDLLKKFAQSGEWLLTDDNGQKLYTERDTSIYDKIKSQWRDYHKRGEKADFSVKDFRTFGSLMLQHSPHRSYRQAWLGHSVKDPLDTNYSGSDDVRVPCRWMEEQLFGNSTKCRN